MNACDVLVVGAGISGLSVAYRLKQAGYTVRCLDPEPAGGVITTIQRDGFLYERGPNSTLETCPELTQLIRDLNLEGDRIYASDQSKNRYILRGGKLIPLPMSPLSFIGTPLFSWRAKLRLMMEPFIGRGPENESLGDFVKRRLGSEFLDYAINPFVAGVYAGDPEQLSVAAGFPKLYALERDYGGLMVGAVRGARARKKRAEVAKDRARMLTFRCGMAQLPRAMATELGDSLVVDKAQRLAKSAGGYTVTTAKGAEFNAPVLVLSTPCSAAADLIAPLSDAVSRTLREVHYPPVTSVALGFQRDDVSHPLDGFGFLVPKKEERSILGVIFSSSLFPQRAPVGQVLLTTFVGGTRQPHLAQQCESELIAMVCRELRELIGVRGEPVFQAMTAWPQAIPQYDLGHPKRARDYQALEDQNPGLFLRANYKDGISVADCVKWSHLTVEQVQAFLKSAA